MLQADADLETFPERVAKIELLVIVNKRAGIDARAAILLHDHPAETAHVLGTLFGRCVRRHAILSQGGHVCDRTRSQEIRKLHDRQVGRQPGFCEQRCVTSVDCFDALLRFHQPGDRYTKAFRMEQAQCPKRHAEVPFTARLVMLDRVRMVKADTESEWVGLFLELDDVGLAIAIGGIVSARKVAEVMSRKITSMNHGQGFVANLVTAGIVIGASRFGMPVSTTHVSCGSLFGIGTVTGQAKRGMIGKILTAWVTTLPLAAILGAVSYWGMSWL